MTMRPTTEDDDGHDDDNGVEYEDEDNDNDVMMHFCAPREHGPWKVVRPVTASVRLVVMMPHSGAAPLVLDQPLRTILEDWFLHCKTFTKIWVEKIGKTTTAGRNKTKMSASGLESLALQMERWSLSIFKIIISMASSPTATFFQCESYGYLT